MLHHAPNIRVAEEVVELLPVELFAGRVVEDVARPPFVLLAETVDGIARFRLGAIAERVGCVQAKGPEFTEGITCNREFLQVPVRRLKRPGTASADLRDSLCRYGWQELRQMASGLQQIGAAQIATSFVCWQGAVTTTYLDMSRNRNAASAQKDQRFW